MIAMSLERVETDVECRCCLAHTTSWKTIGTTTPKARLRLSSTTQRRYCFACTQLGMVGWAEYWVESIRDTITYTRIATRRLGVRAPHYTPCKGDTRMLKRHADCRKSIHKALSSHAKEHFPASTYGAFPVQGKDDVAILLVANKYSPNNFWWASSASHAVLTR